MELNEKTDARPKWTPRLSEEFKEHLRRRLIKMVPVSGVIELLTDYNSIVKTFAKWGAWVGRSFHLGTSLMARIKAIPVTIPWMN